MIIINWENFVPIRSLQLLVLALLWMRSKIRLPFWTPITGKRGVQKSLMAASHLILAWTAFTCPELPTAGIFPWYPSLMFTYAPSAEDCLMSEITLTWICIFRRGSTVRIAAGRRILLVLSLCVKTDMWMTFPGDGGSIKGIPTAKAN